MNQTILNPHCVKIRDGISLFVCCMNRNSNLAQALPTWLESPEIDEIVVLDWSSNEPVKNILDQYNDQRIILARVENQKRWIAARAFNLAARLTTRTQMVKMDADTKISSDFFRIHKLKPGTFMTGNWRKARNENEKHLFGITYLYRADFFKINGFNEQLTLYGWADSDLFERLESIGLQQVDFNLDTLNHIKHENRVKNQQHSLGKNIRDDVVAGFGIQRNRYICKNLLPWNQSFEMTDFEVRVINKNLFSCYQINNTEKYTIPDDLVKQAEKYALRNILSFSLDGLGASIPVHYSQKFSDSILVELNFLFNHVEKKIQANTSGFKLITTLYNESKIERVLEYLNCLHKNYYHYLIDEIHVFYDTSQDQKINLISNYLQKKKNITVKTINGRPTYQDIFNYANQSFMPGSKIIISNADIYFNETLSLVIDTTIKNKFIALTRWNQRQDNNLVLQYDSNGLPNYLSADVWIFQLPLKVDFYCDYELGTPFCDSFLNHQLSKSNLKVYNPCLDIQACHVHKNWSLKKSKLILVENEDGKVENQQQRIVKEWKREGRKDPNRGVVWCYVEDILETPSDMFKWRNHNIILEVYTHGDLYEQALTCFSFLTIAEKIDRNLWIIQSNLNKELIEFIKFIGNGRFNLINLYQLNQDDIVYDEVIDATFNPKIFDFDKNLYIRISSLSDTENSWVTSQELMKILDQYKEFLKNHKKDKEPEKIISIFENKIVYNKLVKFAWNAYTANDLSISIEYLHQSLTYSHRSVGETISDWVEKFSYFCDVYSLPFDVWSFSETPEWKELICSTILSKKVLKTYSDVAPKVSIITSVYNGDKYIEKFLEDITQQTVFHQCELILINPNSPGNEETVIHYYQNLYSNIIYKKLDYDPGLYEVWNLGIKMARGKYITNANLDDRRSPLHIEKHLEVLDSNPDISLVCAALKVTKKDNETWVKNTAHAIWFDQGFSENIQIKDLFRKEQTTGQIVSQCIPHCMPVWRKSLHEKYGYFNEIEYGTSADWEYWLRCLSQGEKFKLIKEPLGIYLENADSYMRNFSQREKMMNKIIKKYYKREYT